MKPSDVRNCPEIDASVIKVRVISEERPDIIVKVGLSLCLVIKFLSQKHLVVKVIVTYVNAVQLRGHVN